MEGGLFYKTFLILGSQLFVTFVATKFVLRCVHDQFLVKHPAVGGTKNADGELDLHIDFAFIKSGFYALLAADVAAFLLLLFFGRGNMAVGIPLFTLWSVLTGIELGLALISVDENLGQRVLGLTAGITFIAAWWGIYSGIDFGWMGGGLMFALLGLLLFNIARLFVAIPRWTQRIGAGFGVVVFSLYLVFDFNQLKKLNEKGVDSWPVAMDLAINIYLDIINLFLELLDAMSD